VQQTVAALKLEKWKRGTVRNETGDRIAVILRDLRDTLPPLLTAADADPGTMSKQLPVSRNVAALYDVLLRVFEAARVAAPPDQIAALDQSLAGLNTARIAFDDRLQDSLAALEKQVGDLQSTVKAQAAFKCPTPPPPVVPVCPPPPTPKPKRRPKPPATTPQAPPTTTTTPKPSN
jgi:outer membrane biosynthesis protein TonB